jgi:hypothetical protein
MTRTLRRIVLVGGLVVAVGGCSFLGSPSAALPTIPPGAKIDCGALLDQALCRVAVQVAITAQLNPPPIVEATVRRPRNDDDCFTAPHPCSATSVIVTLQSGDTLQEVALMPTTDGWALLDQPR